MQGRGQNAVLARCFEREGQLGWIGSRRTAWMSCRCVHWKPGITHSYSGVATSTVMTQALSPCSTHTPSRSASWPVSTQAAKWVVTNLTLGRRRNTGVKTSIDLKWDDPWGVKAGQFIRYVVEYSQIPGVLV
jgi:hypothetical protein